MAKRNAVWRVDDGHDSYRIEAIPNSNGIPPEGCLWFGKDVPRAYKTVEVEQENEEGELVTVEQQVPVDHALCKWIDGDHAPTARTEQEIAAIEAEATQAEAQRIATLAANPVYRAMIDELQADLVTLGLSIPTDETAVMVRMAELKAAGQWTDEHRRAKASIGVTWTAIKSAGLTDDVAAIWAAMQGGE